MNRRFEGIETPAYILDEQELKSNLSVFERVIQSTGCKAILALKAFASFSVFPLLSGYLHGTTASSVHEARLGREEFGKEVHIYSPGYKEADFFEYLKYANVLTFNSFSQWQQFKPLIPQNSNVQFGLRLNPEHSETEVKMYDPCQQFSRLGVTKDEFKMDQLEGISGFLCHTLCGQSAEALARTLVKLEEKFSEALHQVQWVNLGGGHMLTSSDYSVDTLIDVINCFQEKYQVQVIIEPGEAVVYETGYFVSSVVDIIKNEKDIAILDTSAHVHMPDIIEMPYRPYIEGSGEAGELSYTYRLGGVSCLSGDVIGEYSFNHPLSIGDQLVFTNMAQYTIVKNTTFNGLKLPDIYVNRLSGNLEHVRSFSYEDFKSRLS